MDCPAISDSVSLSTTNRPAFSCIKVQAQQLGIVPLFILLLLVLADFPPAPSHSAAANEAKLELTVVKIFATVSVLHFRVDQTSPLTTC